MTKISDQCSGFASPAVQDTKWSVSALIDWTCGYFQKNGITEARLEAELLLAHVLKTDRLSLYLKKDDKPSERQVARYKEFVAQRKTRKPVSYITGEKEFMGMSFKVNEHTLIPRPETELLVEEAVYLINENNMKTAADMGSGSGNISVSISKLTDISKVYAVDVSREAHKILWQNASDHGVVSKIVPLCGSMFEVFGEEMKGKFDIIISNPPYIAESEKPALEPELGFEPARALFGGKDGLDFYRFIAAKSVEYLMPGGYMVLELNSNKSSEIIAMFEESFKIKEIVKDYSGLERVLIARLKL